MGEVWIDRKKGMGGTPGRYLTIKAYPGEEPILRGRRRLVIQADYVRVEGLHFIMPWRCDAYGVGLQIINNKFTGPQPQFGAIQTGGSDILIEENLIQYDNKGGNSHDHGIYVQRGKRITIRNNRIFRARGYGIHVFDEHKSANPADWAVNPFVIKDYLIEGNYIEGAQIRSGMIVAKGRGGNLITLENIIIRNNVFVGNAEFGLLIREGKNIDVYNNTFYLNRIACLLVREPSQGLKPASNVTIKNNIFVGNVHVGNKSPGKNIVLENNLYNAAPRLKGISDRKKIIDEPHFFNAADHNFRLQAFSPAIDAGVDVGLPFNGSAPDLGAFEFGDSLHKVDSLARGIRSIKNEPDTNGISHTDGLSYTGASTNNNRFVSFKAYVVGNSIILNWIAASDTNSNGFEIERSNKDNTDFIKIGYVNTESFKKGHSYQYLDEGLKFGHYYYRLKQIHLDGSFEYSSVVKLSLLPKKL